MEVHAPFIVFEMCTHFWARDTRLRADDVQLQTIQREHYVSLHEVNFQHPPLISVPLSTIHL